MTESIKQIADKLFRANPDPLEISIEEMIRQREKSKEILRNRMKSGKKPSRGKEKLTIGTISPCPKCGARNWNLFPDGRKYCCGCGAVMEIDGTISGGAIKKEISKQISEVDKNMNEILVPFICDNKTCRKIVYFKAPNLEIAMEKKVPHKKYDPKSECDGTLIYLEQGMQIFPNPEPTPIPETRITEKPSIKHVKDSGIIERFQHPKLGKFVCNKCPYLNDCLQRFEDTDTCLKIGMDLKLRKQNELLEKLLQKLNNEGRYNV